MRVDPRFHLVDTNFVYYLQYDRVFKAPVTTGKGDWAEFSPESMTEAGEEETAKFRLPLAMKRVLSPWKPDAKLISPADTQVRVLCPVDKEGYWLNCRIGEGHAVQVQLSDGEAVVVLASNLELTVPRIE